MKKGLIFSGIAIAVGIAIMLIIKTSKKEQGREEGGLKYNMTNAYLVLPGQKVYARDDYINFPRSDNDGAYRYFEFVYLGRVGGAVKIFLRESGYGNFDSKTSEDEFYFLGERFLRVSIDECVIVPIIGDPISFHFGIALNGGIYVFSAECRLHPPDSVERPYESWRRSEGFDLRDSTLRPGP